MRRASLLVAVLAALLAACATERPTPTQSDPSPTPAPTSAAPTASVEASAGPSLAPPAPGRPYESEDILAAMRESRRPGGVPDELETAEIAGAIADEIWTLGGEPWAIVAIGASCGEPSCDVEVAGAPAGGAGEDLYLFRVDPARGAVELLQSILLGIDPATVEALDAYARDRWSGDLDGFALATARWLPPPDDGRFVLAYRSGGEEGSPAFDLLVDVEAGTVSEMPTSRLRPASG